MTISIDPAAEAATIRTARDSEVERLSRALALAFYDDPVFDWFFPLRPGRFDRIVRFFEGISLEQSTMPFGHVYTTDGVAGGALWLPPGEAHSSTAETLRMLPELLRVTGRDIIRALRGLSLMEANHPHEDHWYLWFVGVAPEWRGAGLGSALMRPILDRADDEGMPAYLEATSHLNRRLYERHGFEVTGEIKLPKGPSMWPMWREPR
jgi:GNAT superfamily N-acetyltransferase